METQPFSLIELISSPGNPVKLGTTPSTQAKPIGVRSKSLNWLKKNTKKNGKKRTNSERVSRSIVTMETQPRYAVLGFTGFYRDLLGFTGFYWVLLGFTGFYLDLLNFVRFSLVFLGFLGFYWVLLFFLGSTGFYCFFLGSTGFC